MTDLFHHRHWFLVPNRINRNVTCHAQRSILQSINVGRPFANKSGFKSFAGASGRFLICPA